MVWGVGVKANVQPTSLAAYRELPSRDQSERLVLSAMQPGRVYSNKQIADTIDREAGWVSARRNGLIDRGLVEEYGVIECPVTGRSVNGYRLVAQQAELELS